MFWLIESNEQLDNLAKLGYKEAFIEVVGGDHIKHPKQNYISCIYIHPLLSDKGYLLTLDHSEAFKLDQDRVLEFLRGYDTLYTVDKKNTLQWLMLRNLWDIIIPPNYIDIQLTKTHENFYRLNPLTDDLNYIIPLSKHYEYLSNLYKEVKHKCVKQDTKYAKFFNNKVSLVFAYIESFGIDVNRKKFEKHFHLLNGENTIYTKYNLKTITTRPSNSFRNVNYAALNKNNGCRESFVPSPASLFVEYDFIAYHPSLIAKLIHHDFGNENIHEYFAKQYNTTYEEAKQLTFKQLYGNVFPQYKHLEYFIKLEQFKKDIWEDFNNIGYYESPISGYKFYKDQLENMNPSKLLNYILQHTETANNVLVIWDLIKVLSKYKSKLILYTYDSFLFDYDRGDKGIHQDIQEVFKKHKLQYKINYGESYQFKRENPPSITNN